MSLARYFGERAWRNALKRRAQICRELDELERFITTCEKLGDAPEPPLKGILKRLFGDTLSRSGPSSPS